MNRIAAYCLGFILSICAVVLPASDIPEPTGLPDVKNIELDAPWITITTGGAGRYLVFHLKSINKLALFDVSAGGIIKTIEAPGEDLVLAGGLEKLLVLVPSQNIVHRYTIATLKREKSFPTPANFKPKQFLLGSASQGPIVTYSEPPVTMYSLETFKPLAYKGEVLRQGERLFGDHGYEMTISADGQTVVGWVPNISGQRYHVMKFADNYALQMQSPEGYSHGGRYLKPNPDASLYFQDSMHICGPDLKPLAADHFKDNVLYACDDPRFFLALEKTDRDWNNCNAWICASGTLQKIAFVKDVGNIHGGSLHSEQGRWRYEPRVRYFPSANLLVAMHSGDQKNLRVLRANLKELCDEQSPDGYLHIISNPPRVAWLGQEYAYQIDVLASGKKVRYKLEAGPPGLKVSPQGEVKWKPTTRPEGGVAKVVIVVSDADDTERFHSFDLLVERPAREAGAGAVANNKPARLGDSPRPMPGTPSSPAESVTDDVRAPVKIDDHRLELSSAKYLLSPGLDNKSWLLLQGAQLTPLAADGISPDKSIQFAKPYVRIGERATYWVAVAKDPFRVDIINKKSLAVTKSIAFNALNIEDLVLHPTQPLCYVAYKGDIEVPRYHFIIVNESKGTYSESDDYLGNFLAIDPQGKFLMAGYRDIYEDGARLIFNPDRIHVVPEYGSIDWLIRYDLSKSGMPGKIEIKEKAGGNGRGLRLSLDGQRVSYLSVVGSPMYSKNLAGWHPQRLTEGPVVYPTKEVASTELLAFHPYLPLVACLRADGRSVVLFARESGEVVAGKLDWPEDGLDAATKVHNLQFSPDGKRLVLETSVNAVRYLRAFDLKLSPAEAAAISQGTKELGQPKATSKIHAPLAELDALAGGPGKPMTAKEIGRFFMDSVVVVQNGQGTGSGFLVGTDGYILTCAHCVEDDDQAITVNYRVRKNEGVKTGRLAAQLVERDEERDLALIKIAKVDDLRPVRLGNGKALESGDRLNVIGNPGLGDHATILDYTMTEGIVSNPRRQLLGMTFVQTTAQINPGSSGGPVFNDHGLVIGLVAAKGSQLEGAGFAVPAQDIIAFLVKCATKSGAHGQLQRHWLDASGQKSLQATLQEINEEGVRLKKTDGVEVTVPLTRLSEFDQDFLKLLKN